MEKMYRSVVLAGLLIGLIVNAVATYQLKSELAETRSALTTVTSELQSVRADTTAQVKTFEEETMNQLDEHEKLIVQLENMINYNLDNQ